VPAKTGHASFKFGSQDLTYNDNMQILYPETGHEFTPEMRREMLERFARHLK